MKKELNGAPHYESVDMQTCCLKLSKEDKPFSPLVEPLIFSPQKLRPIMQAKLSSTLTSFNTPIHKRVEPSRIRATWVTGRL